MTDYEDILAQMDDPEELDDELEVQLDSEDGDVEEVQLDAVEQADNQEGLDAMNQILNKLNTIAGEELQTDEQIDAAEKTLLAEL